MSIKAAAFRGLKLNSEPVEQSERPRRPTPAEVRKAEQKFRDSQPLEVVPFRPAEPMQRLLTLRDAHEFILEHGGQVNVGEHDTIVFALPARLVEGVGEHPLRSKLVRACELLDASRGLVRACLQADVPLPDRPPAIGGGVV